MKAIICTKYGPPDVLQLKEVAKPVAKDNQVCIRIHATAVTSSDCYVRSFNIPIGLWIPARLALGLTKPRMPILGFVLAGEIETAGKTVKRFQKGDPVYAFNPMQFGTYAEYTCLSEASIMASKPSNLTFEEAAAIPYGGMLALHFLRKGKIHRGQKVLVYGASGAVGTSAVQLAKYFGAEVTGICSTTNVELLKSIGADVVVDYTKDDFIKGGELFDLILDAVGKAKSSRLKANCRRALTADGIYLSVDQGTPKMRVDDLILLTELAEAGVIRPVIDKRFPLEQVAEAHRYVDKGHKKGNVVVSIGHATLRSDKW